MISFLKKQCQNLMHRIELRKKKIENKKQAEVKSIEYLRNVVAEYNLIQEKKSKLSKKQRDNVEANVAYLIATDQLKVKI
jgi:hypothetical protein